MVTTEIGKGSKTYTINVARDALVVTNLGIAGNKTITGLTAGNVYKS